MHLEDINMHLEDNDLQVKDINMHLKHDPLLVKYTCLHPKTIHMHWTKITCISKNLRTRQCTYDMDDLFKEQDLRKA